MRSQRVRDAAARTKVARPARGSKRRRAGDEEVSDPSLLSESPAGIPESSVWRTRISARVVELRDKPVRSHRRRVHVAAPNDVEPELRELWLDYLEKREDETRNAILRHYLPLVERELKRVRIRLPRHVDPADLRTAAVLGLIEAIQHFDFERCACFEPYGRARVRGAILDELRRTDWMPRTWRARQAMKLRAEATLRLELRREPLDVEVAEALNVTLDEYRARFCVPRSAIQAPAGLPSGLGHQVFDSFVDPRSDGHHKALSDRELVTSLFDDLSEREESILRLKYYGGWTMGRIGRRLRISESRVCRIHQACLDRLKRRLGHKLEDLVG